jgi:phage anti-repressor protein
MSFNKQGKFGSGKNKDVKDMSAEEFWSQLTDTVDAKTLWQFMQVTMRFEQWISVRLGEMEAQSGVDFKLGNAASSNPCSGLSSRDGMEITLTRDLAMEIGILECNRRGARNSAVCHRCRQAAVQTALGWTVAIKLAHSRGSSPWPRRSACLSAGLPVENRSTKAAPAFLFCQRLHPVNIFVLPGVPTPENGTFLRCLSYFCNA